MLFMFQKTSCQDLSVLSSFPNLEELDLWGGGFYTDGVCDTLQQNTILKTHLKAMELDLRKKDTII